MESMREKFLAVLFFFLSAASGAWFIRFDSLVVLLLLPAFALGFHAIFIAWAKVFGLEYGARFIFSWLVFSLAWVFGLTIFGLATGALLGLLALILWPIAGGYALYSMMDVHFWLSAMDRSVLKTLFVFLGVLSTIVVIGGAGQSGCWIVLVLAGLYSITILAALTLVRPLESRI